MSETIKKRWLRPYWEAEALDAWLATQEAAGWRLEGGAFFRRLVFRAAEPKASAWFVTFSEERGLGMYAEGSWLTRYCKADEIHIDTFSPGAFGWANAYRVLKPIDEDSLRELRLSRDLFLRRMARRSLFVWLVGLALSGTVAVWSLAEPSQPVTASVLFFCALAPLCLFWTGYHIAGLRALRKKRGIARRSRSIH